MNMFIDVVIRCSEEESTTSKNSVFKYYIPLYFNTLKTNFSIKQLSRGLYTTFSLKVYSIFSYILSYLVNNENIFSFILKIFSLQQTTVVGEGIDRVGFRTIHEIVGSFGRDVINQFNYTNNAAFRCNKYMSLIISHTMARLQDKKK